MAHRPASSYVIERNYSENMLKVVCFALQVLPPPPLPPSENQQDS
jgi:hypothetical protein